jgi:hypothetical protein
MHTCRTVQLQGLEHQDRLLHSVADDSVQQRAYREDLCFNGYTPFKYLAAYLTVQELAQSALTLSYSYPLRW